MDAYGQCLYIFNAENTTKKRTYAEPVTWQGAVCCGVR